MGYKRNLSVSKSITEASEENSSVEYEMPPRIEFERDVESSKLHKF